MRIIERTFALVIFRMRSPTKISYFNKFTIVLGRILTSHGFVPLDKTFPMIITISVVKIYIRLSQDIYYDKDDKIPSH